jgi:hypothetical protein
MDIPEIKSYQSSPNLFDSLNLLTIVQDEIETVISSESNKHLSKKISKRSNYGFNYKSLLQFGLMTVNLIFQTIILYK